MSALARWYVAHGRHELAWRTTRDRWLVLVSEVMLAQTQVARVAIAWPNFIAQVPTPQAMVDAGPAAVIRAWDRLGYPRRAVRLHEAATIIAGSGWPDDLRELPGVGRYTAGALRAQVDDADDAIAVEVNILRVTRRFTGSLLTGLPAEAAAVRIAAPAKGRDRLLALMDLGALVCTPKAPACTTCPLHIGCATRGQLVGETGARQAPYAGSFRQRRGAVLARLRAAQHVAITELDPEALASLVADGLAHINEGSAALP